MDIDYKCCVCDLDGTLLDSSKKISPEDRNALKLLSNLGVKLVVATGRSDLMIKEYLNDLCINTPVISCNGGLIRDNKTGEVLYMKLINPGLVKKVIDYCERNHMQYLIYTPCSIYHSQYNTRVKSYEEYNETTSEEFRIPLINIKSADRNVVHESTIKILIIDEDISLIDELNSTFNKKNELTIVSSSKGLIDIMAANTTKGGALVKLSNLFNINLEKTVVFGDNYNDISMFQEAGLGIAVSNAEKELKDMAGYVTRSNDESGVGYAIHNYILKNKGKNVRFIG